MRFLIQRVDSASVSTDGRVIGAINKGFLVFVGIYATDTKEIADKLIKKLLGLRIFPDEQGKINLSLKEVGGELLIVSQFTLCADCKKGNRPSFIDAARPDTAKELYEYVIDQCATVHHVEHGEFGAEMIVTISNHGPFTILLDSKDM